MKVAIKEIQLSKENDERATNDAWEDEARALRNINKLNHKHITKCVAAIRRGDRRYFMFPWADGGSLQDFWESIPQHGSPNAGLIKQALEQLSHLADALDVLHNCSDGGNSNDSNRLMPNSTADGKNIRHGDLKPENILRFFDETSSVSTTTQPRLGLLKIADMGLAKQHIHATKNRTKNTSQRYGTVRYEAPEALNEKGGRSRLYDVWSMGCITLEFIIWLLHGNKALEEFHAQVGGPTKQACQYFEGKPPQVHHVVTKWISHFQHSDPECRGSTAMGDLLNIVHKRLLVVELDPRNSAGRKDSLNPRTETRDTQFGFRATAAEFRNALKPILIKVENSPASYLCTDISRRGVQLPIGSDLLTPGAAAMQLNSHQKPNGALYAGGPGRAIREYSVCFKHPKAHHCRFRAPMSFDSMEANLH